ncbi:MAG: PBECR4 domain-containing protein [Acutalibacteraceae bacterium]
MVCTLSRFSAMTLSQKNVHFRLSGTSYYFGVPIFLRSENMKDVQECAELYSTLLKKDYIFTLEGDIRFKLFFNEGNFIHLLGLHKLKDISELNTKSNSAAKIYKNILSGKLSVDKIQNSGFYNMIEKRVENFQEIKNMLNADKCKIIVDFDSRLVSDTELKKTKYILYRHKGGGYVHFTMGFKGNGIYPETFFFENSKRYVNGQVLLDVKNIEVIDI